MLRFHGDLRVSLSGLRAPVRAAALDDGRGRCGPRLPRLRERPGPAALLVRHLRRDGGGSRVLLDGLPGRVRLRWLLRLPRLIPDPPTDGPVRTARAMSALRAEGQEAGRCLALPLPPLRSTGAVGDAPAGLWLRAARRGAVRDRDGRACRHGSA